MSAAVRKAGTRALCASIVGIVSACASSPSPRAPDSHEQLKELVMPATRVLPKDVTNAHADDPAAAELGKKFFFDSRFSGPLLDDANNGVSGSLGSPGDAGRIACASCHVPLSKGFFDSRSPREQLSLGSGWTHRRAPALLEVGQAKLLMWDGRRDSAFSQVFAPIESPLEFNSSRLFVAQQIARLYRKDYEAVFGPMPSLAKYAALEPARAGCAELPANPAHDVCTVPGQDDEDVTRIVTNFGKAIQAYTRQLACGRSRFDAWVDGDESALTADERAGAYLFVGKGGCNQCHSGPYLTDNKFYNLGVPGGLVPFTGVNTSNDPGAAPAFAELERDWLNSRGRFSDGDDGRLEQIPADTSRLLGAFRTPSLRCVGFRPAFMHNGEYRSLEDVIDFFSVGGPDPGTDENYVGTSVNYPRNFSDREKTQLVAFLRALSGDGPDRALLVAPELP